MMFLKRIYLAMKELIVKNKNMSILIVVVLLMNRNFLFLTFILSFYLVARPFLPSRKIKIRVLIFMVLIMVAVPGGPPLAVAIFETFSKHPAAEEQELAAIHGRWAVKTPLDFHFRIQDLQKHEDQCGAVKTATLWIYGWDLESFAVDVHGAAIQQQKIIPSQYPGKLKIDFVPASLPRHSMSEIKVTLASKEGKTGFLLLGPETDGKDFYPEAVMLALDLGRCRLAYHEKAQETGYLLGQPRVTYKLREAGR